MSEIVARAEEVKEVVVAVLHDMKAQDIEVLNVTRLTDVTDYMVIASGTSNRHVKSIADRLREQVREQTQIRPIGVEGEAEGEWVLLDFGDVVVHIMRPLTRKFYDLERLWSREVEELVRMNRDSPE